MPEDSLKFSAYGRTFTLTACRGTVQSYTRVRKDLTETLKWGKKPKKRRRKAKASRDTVETVTLEDKDGQSYTADFADYGFECNDADLIGRRFSIITLHPSRGAAIAPGFVCHLDKREAIIHPDFTARLRPAMAPAFVARATPMKAVFILGAIVLSVTAFSVLAIASGYEWLADIAYWTHIGAAVFLVGGGLVAWYRPRRLSRRFKKLMHKDRTILKFLFKEA